MQRLGFAGQLAVLAAVCLVGLLTSRDVAAQRQSQLYAAVTDTNGEPVLDLTDDDFGLSIGDTPLTIISAEVDSAPMKVALMVDNGNSIVEANADTALRDALAAFVDTLGRSTRSASSRSRETSSGRSISRLTVRSSGTRRERSSATAARACA